MAQTESTMLELGTKAPEFSLKDAVRGEVLTFGSIAGDKGTVAMFICCHCPYVIHVQNEVARIAREYTEKGLGFVAISSNDVENYPQDSPVHMKAQAEEQGFVFPYLYDKTQQVARSYDAACTPDFYLFDESDCLVYRGRLDDSRPGNGKPVTGRDLRTALDNLLTGKPQSATQFPSVGCNIKWK